MSTHSSCFSLAAQKRVILHSNANRGVVISRTSIIAIKISLKSKTINLGTVFKAIHKNWRKKSKYC